MQYFCLSLLFVLISCERVLSSDPKISGIFNINNFVYLSKSEPATNEDIVEAEMKLGLKIPEPIERFLKNSNGGLSGEENYVIDEEDVEGLPDFVVFEYIIGTQDVIKNRNPLGWPDDLLPIGKDSGGNYVLYDQNGLVYHWSVDGLIDQQYRARGERRLIEIARDFDSFLQMLKPASLLD